MFTKATGVQAFRAQRPSTRDGLQRLQPVLAPCQPPRAGRPQPVSSWLQVQSCVLGSRSTPGPANLSSIACLLLAPSFSPVSPHPPSWFWSGPPLNCGSDGKASACNAGDSGSIPGLGRSPGGGNGYPLQYSSLESPMDRAWWATYSLWGRKESDTTERLSPSLLSPSFFIHLPALPLSQPSAARTMLLDNLKSIVSFLFPYKALFLFSYILFFFFLKHDLPDLANRSQAGGVWGMGLGPA